MSPRWPACRGQCSPQPAAASPSSSKTPCAGAISRPRSKWRCPRRPTTTRSCRSSASCNPTSSRRLRHWRPCTDRKSYRDGPDLTAIACHRTDAKISPAGSPPAARPINIVARGFARGAKGAFNSSWRSPMTFVVVDYCVKCKYTDCVEVCPVDCFHEGPNFVVIDPDECIDCTLCEPECPAEAIFAEDDVPEDQQEY